MMRLGVDPEVRDMGSRKSFSNYSLMAFPITARSVSSTLRGTTEAGAGSGSEELGDLAALAVASLKEPGAEPDLLGEGAGDGTRNDRLDAAIGSSKRLRTQLPASEHF